MCRFVLHRQGQNSHVAARWHPMASAVHATAALTTVHARPGLVIARQEAT
jgi:hypothetical protein